MTPADQQVAAMLRAVRRSWIALVSMPLALTVLSANALLAGPPALSVAGAVLFLIGLAWWGTAAIRLRRAIKRCEEVRHGRA